MRWLVKYNNNGYNINTVYEFKFITEDRQTYDLYFRCLKDQIPFNHH